jgi:hypothetical protein
LRAEALQLRHGRARDRLQKYLATHRLRKLAD